MSTRYLALILHIILWFPMFAATQSALDPNVLYDVGFQLSFGAVLSLPKFLIYAQKHLA